MVQASNEVRSELLTLFSRVMQELRRALPNEARDFGRGALIMKLHLHGPSRPSELAARTDLDLSTVSRHLTALERDGLVARLADPADGRAHLVELTRVGQEHLADLFAARSHMVTAATASWTSEERTELELLLRRLADDLVALREPEKGQDI